MNVPTGVLVVQRGVATQAMVDQAWREAKAMRERICTRLLAMGVPEGRLAAVLSDRHGVPGVDLSHTSVDLALLDLVPRLVAEGDSILPLSDEGGRLHLAMANPGDERVLGEVRFVTGREVSPYVAVDGALRTALREAYDARERGEATWHGSALREPVPPAVASVLPDGDEEVAIEAEDLVPVDVDDLQGEDEPLVLEEEARVHELDSGRARLVLVVDDEPDIRQLVRKALEKAGYKVETASDGAEAIAMAEELVPDLVLLDAMLPKVHGFEACRRIKAGAKTRHVPVVMMTAIYRGWRFAQDARESYGAQDYVEKPFRLDDLLRRVEAALTVSAEPAVAPEPSAAAAAQIARGKELLLAHQLHEARAAFEAALQADPHSSEGHALLARTLRAAGDAFGAMTAFERAAELRPGWLPVLRALAALYEEKGFKRKAVEALERALAAAPDEGARAAIKQELLALLG